MASTNRDPWALCVPKLPLRHRTPGRMARLQSMDGSLPPPLLQNRACHFCGTRLLSDVPSVIGIRPTVNDNRADLWSDVSRLSLVGHRSLTPQHGSSASPALLLPITCPSPSSRQHIRGIALGLGFLRNPSPSALRLAPAPVLHCTEEHGWGYFVPDPSLAMHVGWSTLPGACGVNARHAEKGEPRHQCLLAPACQPLTLVQHNDSFMTFLCVPLCISARGVARGGSELIRFHACFTD
jgi:hypothetical protein